MHILPQKLSKISRTMVIPDTLTLSKPLLLIGLVGGEAACLSNLDIQASYGSVQLDVVHVPNVGMDGAVMSSPHRSSSSSSKSTLLSSSSFSS